MHCVCGVRVGCVCVCLCARPPPTPLRWFAEVVEQCEGDGVPPSPRLRARGPSIQSARVVSTAGAATLADVDDEDDVQLAAPVEDGEEKGDDPLREEEEGEEGRGALSGGEGEDTPVEEGEGEEGPLALAEGVALRVGQRGYVPSAYCVPAVPPEAKRPPRAQPGDLLLVQYPYAPPPSGGPRSPLASPLHHVLMPEAKTFEAGPPLQGVLTLDPLDNVVLLVCVCVSALLFAGVCVWLYCFADVSVSGLFVLVARKGSVCAYG